MLHHQGTVETEFGSGTIAWLLGQGGWFHQHRLHAADLACQMVVDFFDLPQVDPRDERDLLTTVSRLTDNTLGGHGKKIEQPAIVDVGATIKTKSTCARHNEWRFGFERNDSLRRELADRAGRQ